MRHSRTSVAIRRGMGIATGKPHVRPEAHTDIMAEAAENAVGDRIELAKVETGQNLLTQSATVDEILAEIRATSA